MSAADNLKSNQANPRYQVAQSLCAAAQQFPDLLPVEFNPTAMDGRDRGLALAIHRSVLQRWLTLQYLLDRHLRKPLRDIEPALQAVFLSGAAQLVFMDRLPAHAVVDESVKVARQLVRPGAAGLVNAVLRRLAQDVTATVRDQAWTPGRDRLPVDEGFVQLSGPHLPPVEPLVEHLEVVTSTPRALLHHWRQAFGRDRMMEQAVHCTRVPPTTIAVEPGFNDYAACHPHTWAGFVVWEGSRQELIQTLSAHRARRVQDPASAIAVNATKQLKVRCAIDYCAGRGTKTRQLAALHPEARIIATDVDASRFSDLTQTFAHHPTVKVVKTDALAGACDGERADLLLLDVPCSNTAVFARRPEARYRWTQRGCQELIALQRRIAENALPLLGRGHLLYSTCSLDPRENQDQARWLAKRTKGQIVAEEQTWPAGVGDNYHDGSYCALLAVG